jgi:hypothetical protein
MSTFGPVIARVLRSRWLAGCIHASLWLLLYLALTNLGGRSFDYREIDAANNPPQTPVPVARIETLFSPGAWLKPAADTNAVSPFWTRHFIPLAPPPPTTRTIEVTYQGFYQTVGGPNHAIFKLGDAFVAAPVGAKIATALFVADATVQALTLTNLTAQTNIVPLNVKKDIVIPIQ